MHSSPLLKKSSWFVAASVLGLTLSLQAQSFPDTATAPTEYHAPSKNPIDIPSPPRNVLNELPSHGAPAIPIGTGTLPQPTDPPCTAMEINQQAEGAGKLVTFRNRKLQPSGIGSLNPGEPAIAQNRDICFATGNTYGALSKDSGMTWTHVNPYTKFTAKDGGVCCDQRTLYVPGTDITIWYIQYRYSATTQTGGFRLAVSKGRDNLKNGAWYSAYFAATKFSQPAKYWLDFPDMAASKSHLYIATNVFERLSNGGNSWRNAIVARFKLADLATSKFSASYYRSKGGNVPMGGASYRFAQTRASSRVDAMYWADTTTTTKMSVYKWFDSNTSKEADKSVTIPAWASGAGSSKGPDGRDWIGNDDRRVASGVYRKNGEISFFHTSKNQTNRPNPYIRVNTVDTARKLTRANDIWFGGGAAGNDLAYPAAGVNSQGDVGMVMSVGSATRHVTTAMMLVDKYKTSYGGNTIYYMTTGTHGAPTSRWGDYHEVHQNPIVTTTFNGTGMRMNGGTSSSKIEHRYAWFGRDDYTPTWVKLSVSSTGVTSGVKITVAETDRSGNKDGTTPFTRSYTPQQGYTLTAPATHLAGRIIYKFDRWYSFSTAQPVGKRTLTISNIQAADDTARAHYKRSYVGGFYSYGKGCPGYQNKIPAHTGSGTPENGKSIGWSVSARPSSKGAICVGSSSQSLHLAVIGNSGCYWLVKSWMELPISTNSKGGATLNMKMPKSSAVIGTNLYSQYAIIDASVKTPLPLAWSNGLRTYIGGTK